MFFPLRDYELYITQMYLLTIFSKSREYFCQAVVFIVDYKHNVHWSKVVYSLSLGKKRINFGDLIDFGIDAWWFCDLLSRLTSILPFIFQNIAKVKAYILMTFHFFRHLIE